MIPLAALPWGFILRIGGPILLAVGVFSWGYSAGHANVQRKWDKERAAQTEVNLEAERMARQAERLKFTAVQEASNAAEKKLRAARASADSDATTVSGLLVTIKGLRESSRAAGTTCESLRERNDAVFGLLEEGIKLAAEGRARVERLDARVTGLQAIAGPVCVSQP